MIFSLSLAFRSVTFHFFYCPDERRTTELLNPQRERERERRGERERRMKEKKKNVPSSADKRKTLGGKGLSDRVDVFLRCAWGGETNTGPCAPEPYAAVEMIINISDFNETNFTKDEKPPPLPPPPPNLRRCRRTTSNAKFPFVLAFCFYLFFLL